MNSESKKVVIDGVEVKVGMKIVISDWLAFTYEVVEVINKRKIRVALGKSQYSRGDVLTKCIKGNNVWKMNGYRRVKVDFTPNMKAYDAQNNAVYESERWMCM